MAKGPRGEKRPADVIGNAVHVMRIATGEKGFLLSTDALRVRARVASLGNDINPLRPLP